MSRREFFVSRKMCIRDSGQTEEEARAMFQEMAQEYEEKYPQVQLEITSFEASEYPEVLKEAAEDGELPDVFDLSLIHI